MIYGLRITKKYQQTNDYLTQSIHLLHGMNILPGNLSAIFNLAFSVFSVLVFSNSGFSPWLTYVLAIQFTLFFVYNGFFLKTIFSSSPYSGEHHNFRPLTEYTAAKPRCEYIRHFLKPVFPCRHTAV